MVSSLFPVRTFQLARFSFTWIIVVKHIFLDAFINVDNANCLHSWKKVCFSLWLKKYFILTFFIKNILIFSFFIKKMGMGWNTSNGPPLSHLQMNSIADSEIPTWGHIKPPYCSPAWRPSDTGNSNCIRHGWCNSHQPGSVNRTAGGHYVFTCWYCAVVCCCQHSQYNDFLLWIFVHFNDWIGTTNLLLSIKEVCSHYTD